MAADPIPADNPVVPAAVPETPVFVNEVDTNPAAAQTAVEAVTEVVAESSPAPAAVVTPVVTPAVTPAAEQPAAAGVMSKVWSVSLPYNQPREIVSDTPISEAEAIRLYCEGMGIRTRKDGTPDTQHVFSTTPVAG